MWPDSRPLRGLARFNTFGLRREWLELALDAPETWMEAGALGPRQKDALRSWLRTLEITDNRGRETPLAGECRRRGLDDAGLWQELWVRAVFNWTGAAWYVLQGCGSRTTGGLKALLAADAPHLSGASVDNCVKEIAGLLERTPIGAGLGQGAVTGAGARRTVTRDGLRHPRPAALGLALDRLFRREGADVLDRSRPLPWPWTVFGCREDDARLALAEDARFIWEDTAVRRAAGED